ncbi:MAG: hypothetical protein ACRERE_38835 [Candidatus Entotheonellia bacterium]
MRHTPFDVAARWREVSEELMAGIKEWRLQHPKAAIQEIEAAVDTRLAELRTRMLQDIVLASQAADMSQARAGAAEMPALWNCCGAPGAA